MPVCGQRVRSKGETNALKNGEDAADQYAAQNIHVAHVIVDGLIESQSAIDHFGMEKGSRFPDGSVSSARLSVSLSLC